MILDGFTNHRGRYGSTDGIEVNDTEVMPAAPAHLTRPAGGAIPADAGENG